jgi:quercetin 2,3-dioxygenase
MTSERAADAVTGRGLEVSASHHAEVGRFGVRRALPRRGRRTIGAWCFADHMGPADVSDDQGLDIGPHPHCGLQTVTWLIEGQALHRDSLGSEQLITPGTLNLMTAGEGVAHSEEATGHYRGALHGIQLWIAQPDHTRHGPAAFEHHDDLPGVELASGVATLLIGAFRGVTSAARRDSELVGIDLELVNTDDLELRSDFEHGFIVLAGHVEVDGTALTPGHLGYLAPGRDEVRVRAVEPSRVIMLGGVPFEEPILMWWNFVARSREEIDAAYDAWTSSDERFGHVASALARVDTPAPYWRPPRGPSALPAS